MSKFWSTLKSSELRRTPMGLKRRVNYQAEKKQGKVFEDWLDLHGWDWWHDNTSMRSKAGLPDYLLLRERQVWVELKARSPITNKIGKLSPEQRVFHEKLLRAGAELYVWWLPDDWPLAEKALA